MGRKAAELLIDRVTGRFECPMRRVVLNPELVVRESCGAYHGHVPALAGAGAGDTPR